MDCVDHRMRLLELESNPDQVHLLIQSMMAEDLLFELATSLRLLPFEARKDCQTIFSAALRFKHANSSVKDPPVISYIVHDRPEIVVELCRGYAHAQSAMPCGSILREAIKNDVIAAIVLYDESQLGEEAVRLNEVQPGNPQTGNGVFWSFFEWINQGSFEVSADAFNTFRVSTCYTDHYDACLQYRLSSRNTSRLFRRTSRPTTLNSSRHTTIPSSHLHHMSRSVNPSSYWEKFYSTAPTILL